MNTAITSHEIKVSPIMTDAEALRQLILDVLIKADGVLTAGQVVSEINAQRKSNPALPQEEIKRNTVANSLVAMEIYAEVKVSTALSDGRMMKHYKALVDKTISAAEVSKNRLDKIAKSRKSKSSIQNAMRERAANVIVHYISDTEPPATNYHARRSTRETYGHSSLYSVFM
jgi:hypothetical protein